MLRSKILNKRFLAIPKSVIALEPLAIWDMHPQSSTSKEITNTKSLESYCQLKLDLFKRSAANNSSYSDLKSPIVLQDAVESELLRLQKTCSKIIIDIHRITITKLQPYVFREGRTRERAEIIAQAIVDLEYTFAHYRQIVDTFCAALVLHRIGTFTTLYSEDGSAWICKYFGDFIRELASVFASGINTALGKHMMMAFWGIGRMGPDFLNSPLDHEKYSTVKDLFEDLYARLLVAEDVLKDNNMGNVIDALTWADQVPTQEQLDKILEMAKYHDGFYNTSPFNVTLLLRGAAAKGLVLPEKVLDHAIGNFVSNIPRLHMHYLVRGIRAIATLRPKNSENTLEEVRIRLEDGKDLMNPMWNQDVVLMVEALSIFDIELVCIKEILDFCVNYVRTRVVPLTPAQSEIFRSACNKVGYVIRVPLEPMSKK